MTSILDRVGNAFEQFSPATILDCCGLRLAQKLDDAEAAEHYVKLVDRYGLQTLLEVYHRCANRRTISGPAFHAELQREVGT